MWVARTCRRLIASTFTSASLACQAQPAHELYNNWQAHARIGAKIRHDTHVPNKRDVRTYLHSSAKVTLCTLDAVTAACRWG